MAPPERTIIIIAGPLGPCKTTFTNQLLSGDRERLPFVNADFIARGLNPDEPEADAFRAGKLMLRRIQELVNSGESFAFETILSGRGFACAIPDWQSQRYRVELYFLIVASPETSIARVARRVRQGVHHVPEDVIRRRLYGGLRNFHEVYKPLVDSWVLDDGTGPTQIALDQG